MTINWKKLYSLASKRRKELDVSWRQLALDNGLTASAFTRISQGKPLSAENYMKVLFILDPVPSFDVYYK